MTGIELLLASQPPFPNISKSPVIIELLEIYKCI
jgi:hypothetical protein